MLLPFLLRCCLWPLLPAIKRCLPTGAPPPREALEGNFFRFEFIAHADGAETPAAPAARLTILGGDPALLETTKMLVEAAACLALSRPDLPMGPTGGFATPAVALGGVLVGRLRAKGMVFDLTPQGAAGAAASRTRRGSS